MKEMQISRFGGPDVFRLTEKPSPMLPEDHVRIEVHASGVNFADIMMRAGMYPEAPKPPFAPGYEIAGKITATGSKVTQFKPGDRVVAGCRFGGYATEYDAHYANVRKIPAHLSEAEAASIPVNFLTAWVALHEMGRIRKGDRVLVQSAAGGVGIAATQIAARAGASITGLVGNLAKAEVVKSLGSSQVLSNQEWEEGDDKKLGGYDIILDATGGASFKRSLRRLAPMGRVVSFGVSAMVGGEKRSLLRAAGVLLKTPFLTPFKLMMENKGVFGLNLLQLFSEEHTPRINRILDDILREFEQGHFKVVVGKTFPLEEAGAAHHYLQSRANIGKVVLVSDTASQQNRPS
jgi:NADPH:quinone reductase-like Zn-dependent oxidoreductase